MVRRCEKLAGPAIEAGKRGHRIRAETMGKHLFRWMRDIQDWCISRQLWWGHRIPAWYDTEGNVYVGKDEASIRTTHELPVALR